MSFSKGKKGKEGKKAKKSGKDTHPSAHVGWVRALLFGASAKKDKKR